MTVVWHACMLCFMLYVDIKYYIELRVAVLYVCYCMSSSFCYFAELCCVYCLRLCIIKVYVYVCNIFFRGT